MYLIFAWHTFMAIHSVRWVYILEIGCSELRYISVYIAFTNVSNRTVVIFIFRKMNNYFMFVKYLIFALKPSFRITYFERHMVVETSIFMVFYFVGPMKGPRFSTGTSKGFLHNFYKRFTCWKSINISLVVSNEVSPSCLTWINFICHFAWWASSHRVFTIHYLFSLENTHTHTHKCRGRATFKNFIFHIIMQIIFADNSFPFPIKQCCVTFTRIYILLPFRNIVNRKGEDKYL